MDTEVYNEIEAGFADDDLNYGERDVQSISTANVLNEVVRRPLKRSSILDDCDALDWHMRVNCDNYERERDMERATLSDEMVERLKRRILWARRKRHLAGMQRSETEVEGNEENVFKSKKNEVFVYPPCDGTPWIGFTAPTELQRFYIMLRNTEQAVDDNVSSKLRSRALKLGLTNKVLNSGTDSEVLNTGPEDMDSGYVFFQDNLWVEKYAPHTYADLVSDETVNRLLLNWIKLWDECVFHRPVPDAVVRGASYQQITLSNEKPRRPSHKVVLLTGPAGSGKTTLANLVAQHAGYRVVSLNASDERNTADFEKCFEDALRTTRTLDVNSKPNCLILDEIDGTPTQSIHYLCKAVTAIGRHSLRRPVICICNNLYTPSLRELRSIGLVIQLTRTHERSLIKRLQQISKLEHLKVESSALSEIVNACSRDLRSAINNLQFIASKNCAIVDRKAVIKFCERGKQFGDKSLFDSWASVFEISRHLDASGRVHDIGSRVKQITLISELHGNETDRFYMGLFTNYLNSRNANVLLNASMAIRQLCYYDRIITSVNSVQDYSLLKYLPAVCISLHVLLCCRGRIHLNFPTDYHSAIQRYEQSFEIVESVRSGATQKNLSLTTVALEILPYLIWIVQPDLKPMNTQLYSIRELDLLRSIVNIMCSYSLNFTPVSQDGIINFVFKPAIDQLVWFTDGTCHKNRSAITLSSAARQLIAHEIELEKLRSVGALDKESVGNMNKELEELNKHGKFGAGVTFCYSAGSSSAIRRQIMIKNLFLS